MTEDGGRRGRDAGGRRARGTLRVVEPADAAAPPPAGSTTRDGSAASTPSSSLSPSPTLPGGTTSTTGDDGGGREARPPGLANRRRGTPARPGTGHGAATTGRIPVYPRMPSGPLRLPGTPGVPALPAAAGPSAGPPPARGGPVAPVASAPTTPAVTADPDDDAGVLERPRAQAEHFVAEDEVLAAARERAATAGIVPVGVGASAALTFLAAAGRARSVVEIGTGAGVGTVSLLRGMPREGLLTSIDVEVSHQRLARQACAEAGFGANRIRMITGRALDVLPRLSDAGYDLVLVDAVTVEYPRYLEEAVRLLRPGGVVVVDNVLWTGRVSDQARREAISAALRETVRLVRADERLAPLLLPVSDGLLCASRLP